MIVHDSMTYFAEIGDPGSTGLATSRQHSEEAGRHSSMPNSESKILRGFFFVFSKMPWYDIIKLKRLSRKYLDTYICVWTRRVRNRCTGSLDYPRLVPLLLSLCSTGLQWQSAVRSRCPLQHAAAARPGRNSALCCSTIYILNTALLKFAFFGGFY